MLYIGLYALLFRLTGRCLRVQHPILSLLLPEYAEADLVLSCGGGNFYAEHSRSPAFFWNLISIALPLWMGKRVIMLPQSIGPVRGRIQRFLLRLSLQGVSLIMVREEISRRFVSEELRLSTPLVELPDLAFSMPRAGGEEVHLESDFIHLGITAIDRRMQLPTFTNQARYEAALIHTIRQLAPIAKIKIHLFAQVYGPSANQDDRRIMGRLYREVADLQNVRLVPPFLSAAAAAAAYARLDGMIASRMHAGIFALSSNVPTILIGYQPKAEGMIRAYGLMEYYCHIDDVAPETLLSLGERLISNRRQLRRRIAAHNEGQDRHRRLWEDYVNI